MLNITFLSLLFFVLILKFRNQSLYFENYSQSNNNFAGNY
jgi:hypothetical protein